jgi:predicted dienelactone hydrolase
MTADLPVSARDPRFIVALPQAPAGAAIYGPSGFDGVTIPTMIQGGTSDMTAPFATEQLAPFDALEGDAYLLGVDKAGHFTFSDICELAATVGITSDFEDGCASTNIAPALAHAVIDRYATAFFQDKLAGERAFSAELDAGGTLLDGVASFQAK